MKNPNADNQPARDNGREGGRMREPNRTGGASREAHQSPRIDRNDTTAEDDRQIAQDRQQSTGQGLGRS